MFNFAKKSRYLYASVSKKGESCFTICRLTLRSQFYAENFKIVRNFYKSSVFKRPASSALNFLSFSRDTRMFMTLEILKKKKMSA